MVFLDSGHIVFLQIEFLKGKILVGKIYEHLKECLFLWQPSCLTNSLPCKSQNTSNRVSGSYFILRIAPDLQLGNQARELSPQPHMVTEVLFGKAEGSFMVNDPTGVLGIGRSRGFTC